MATQPDIGELDLREQVARIDKLLAEIHAQPEITAKLNEETRKFVAEQHKLMAEGDKLRTEAAKLDRERVWFPWLQLLTVAISSAAIGAVVAKLFH